MLSSDATLDGYDAVVLDEVPTRAPTLAAPEPEP